MESCFCFSCYIHLKSSNTVGGTPRAIMPEASTPVTCDAFSSLLAQNTPCRDTSVPPLLGVSDLGVSSRRRGLPPVRHQWSWHPSAGLRTLTIGPDGVQLTHFADEICLPRGPDAGVQRLATCHRPANKWCTAFMGTVPPSAV